MRVLGMGNALVDMMTELPDDHLLDEFDLQKGSMQLVDKEFSNHVLGKIQQLKKSEISGGSAANTICGLAAMGIETAFIGKVGKDRLGEVFEKDLVRNGIHPLLQYSDNETGLALALVSPDGERTFATHLGAAVELEPDDLTSDMFQGYTHFYIEGYLVQHHELIRRAVELARENSLDVILDLASFNVVEDNLDFLHFLVEEYADVVFANADEARTFTDGKKPEDALEEIAEDCWIAVVKTGKNGSLIQNGRQVYRVPASRVNCIDTTGAGDLYASGFLYGMLNDLDLPLCGEIGSILAGKVIEVIGARIPDATWPEIKDRVKKVIYKQIG
ncbi:MAG: adenosine kinase [Bacteroidales bacterium]|nr:adenosine kinase [Bacteroidales bacterium]